MNRLPVVLISLAVSQYSQGLDQQFFSIKHTELTPVIDDSGSVFPKDSIDFESSAFKEVMYQSPTNKAFSIQLTGLLNADNKFDELKAIFDWGGMVIVGGSGSIKGTFNETDEARLPGNQDPDALFQTLIPSNQSFKGESEFLAIGWTKHDSSIIGIAYKKSVAPVLLSVDTNQFYTFGLNPYTQEYENYHPEGTFPSDTIDAEGTIEHLGLWMRLDPLKDAFEKVARSKRMDIDWFFGAELFTGLALYTPGDTVAQEYALATEQVAASRGEIGKGTTLNVAESTSLISNHLIYATGVQVVMPVSSMILGLSVGIEGGFGTNWFEAEPIVGSTSGADAELFTESVDATYGFCAGSHVILIQEKEKLKPNPNTA